jgi:hypothetical protein
MPNLATIPVPATVSAGAAVALNKTPLLGGQGREGKLSLPNGGLGTGVVQIQGAPRPVAGGVPANGDYTTITTLNSSSAPMVEIADLPDFIRANVTTAPPAATSLILEGVQ